MKSKLKVQNTSVNDEFKIWAWACSHQESDLNNGRDSIGEAITQVDGENGFEYDFAINAGDFGSRQAAPTLDNATDEGETIVASLETSKKARGKMYSIAGNHDAGDYNMNWFLRYIDPLGENTSYSGVDSNDNPYQINLMGADTWHSYYIKFNKHLIVFLSDRNELPYPYGRGDSPVPGGLPSGTISLETWNWFKNLVLTNANRNIYVLSHMNPRNTTIGTPDTDGVDGDFHSDNGIGAGSGGIYSIYDESNDTSLDGSDSILDFFRDNPNHTVVNWMAGHSHAYLNETYRGRSEVYTIHGVTFMNIGHLTVYHTNATRPTPDPTSKLLTIKGNNLNVKTYLHEIADGNPIGFYPANEFNIKLKV